MNTKKKNFLNRKINNLLGNEVFNDIHETCIYELIVTLNFQTHLICYCSDFFLQAISIK